MTKGIIETEERTHKGMRDRQSCRFCVENQAKGRVRHFIKGKAQMASKLRKRSSILLVIREIQIKVD